MPQMTETQKSMLITRIIENLDLLIRYFTEWKPDPKPYQRVSEIIRYAYEGDIYSKEPVIDKLNLFDNLFRVQHSLWGIFHADFNVLKQNDIINNYRDSATVTAENYPAEAIKEYAIDVLKRALKKKAYGELSQYLDELGFPQPPTKIPAYR